MADLQARLLDFVDPEIPEEAHDAAFAEILDAVRRGQLSVPQLVGSLAEQLTTEDNGTRSRACQLLAGVVKGMPDVPLEDTAIHSLSEFFASRLADFPSLRGALTGSLALLKRPPQVGALRPDDVLGTAKAFLNSVHVQSLTAVDRLLSFELLETLIESHAPAVSALGGDFLDGLVAAIDGEKDPRCLLLAFRLVEIVPQVFKTGSGGIFAEAAEELFEVIAVYFPVSFNPPPNDTRGISREDLVLALQRALAVTPLFAPFSFPLFVEKLSSSLTSAKLDSLRALQACAQSYGSAIAPQTGPLWTALKAELLPQSVEASSAGDVGPIPEKSAEVEDAAAEALTQCVRALAGASRGTSPVSNPLVHLVLEDPSLGDLFSGAKGDFSVLLTSLPNQTGNQGTSEDEQPLHQRSASSQPDDFTQLRLAPQDAAGKERRQESVQRWSRVLSAVATAGAAPCSQVAEALLAKVTSSGSVGYTELRLLSELARSARMLAWADVSGGPEEKVKEKLDIGTFLGGRAEVFGRIFCGVLGAQRGTSNVNLEELATLAVSGVEALAAVPPLPSLPDSTPLLQEGVSVLVEVLLPPHSDARIPTPLQQRTLQALASISRGAPVNNPEPSDVLQTNAEMTRVQLGDDWQGAREVWAAVSERVLPGLTAQGFPLHTVATLAGSSGFINREVLTALQGLLNGLWDEMRRPGESANETGAVEVLRLLAHEILPRFGPGASDQGPVLDFVHTLLERLATWPPPGRPEDGLLAAALGALSVAVRICTETNQAALYQKSLGAFSQALQSGEVWRAGPVLAILVGLRPSVSANAGQARLLQGLLSLALQRSDVLIADAASVALASLLNKWPTDIPRHSTPAAWANNSAAFPSSGVAEQAGSQLHEGGEIEIEPERESAASERQTAVLFGGFLDTSFRHSPLGQPATASGVSTPLSARAPATGISSSPVTPASTQALPSGTPPRSAASSTYSPAVFLNSSPQSVLFDTTPVSVLQQPGFSPAGGPPGPSPDPPGVTSVPRAPSPGDIPIRARRVAQRLDLSPLGAPNAAINAPPRGVQPTIPQERSSNESTAGAETSDLDTALRLVLDETLLPQIRGLNPESGRDGLEAHVRVLAAVGQGLAMRGHKRTGDAVGALVELLFTLGKENASAAGANAFERSGQGEWAGNGVPRVSPATLASFQPEAGYAKTEAEKLSTTANTHQDTNEPPSTPTISEETGQLADVAAESFGVITGERHLSSEGLSADLILSKETHAQIKPLYRQRLFTLSLGPFSEAIRRAKNPEERLPLYRGLSHLLKGTPPAALALEAEKVLLLLLESLSALAASPPPANVRTPAPASDAPLVLSNLLTLTTFLVDRGPGREHAGEHVPSIVRTLVRLTSYKASTGVRETALQALVAAAELPFTRVYPLRNEVHKAIVGALDDPKRAVRKEAVRCRRVWTALGSSKK